jgi:hypothetical protein
VPADPVGLAARGIDPIVRKTLSFFSPYDKHSQLTDLKLPTLLSQHQTCPEDVWSERAIYKYSRQFPYLAYKMGDKTLQKNQHYLTQIKQINSHLECLLRHP